ncbi:MAG: hypothetical protein COA49_01645 [Bacteroidetes bacterium]|nr:MAG: hypothetical protein COA49_01645 [Bacteroidota bacterium]
MHHSPDALAGFSLYLKGKVSDSIKSALDSWGLVVYSGDSFQEDVHYDLVIEKDQIPMKDSDSIFQFLSDNFPPVPAVRADEKAINLLYKDMPELILEVNTLAKASLQEDLEVLRSANDLDVTASILHKMKTTLAHIGYIGLQSEVVAWERIWKHGQGQSSRFENWTDHKDSLLSRISAVEELL